MLSHNSVNDHEAWVPDLRCIKFYNALIAIAPNADAGILCRFEMTCHLFTKPSIRTLAMKR